MRSAVALSLCLFVSGIGSLGAAEPNEIRLPDEKFLLPLADGGNPRRVRAPGRIIKWLDYRQGQNGAPDDRVFYMACNRVLAAAPFLVHSLRYGTLAIDTDGDSKVELMLDIGPPLDTVREGEIRPRILYRAPNLPIELEELAADVLRSRDFDPAMLLEFLPASRKCRDSPVSELASPNLSAS
jgi:hypothetical protein